MLWYVLFFAIALKLPTLWLCWVVWWAIKAKPDHETGGTSRGYGGTDTDGDGPGPIWWTPGSRADRRTRHDGPHGAPARRPVPARMRPGVTYIEKSDVAEQR